MSRIPILWPELKVDAVTPAAVLQVQAAGLEQLTHGILIGQVVGGEAEDQDYLHLDILAPALGTSFRVVTITHKKGFPYPASVSWIGQAPVSALVEQTRKREASSEDQLSAVLAEVLGSPSVTAAVYSLLARSNEVEAISAASVNGGRSGKAEVGTVAE